MIGMTGFHLQARFLSLGESEKGPLPAALAGPPEKRGWASGMGEDGRGEPTDEHPSGRCGVGKRTDDEWAKSKDEAAERPSRRSREEQGPEPKKGGLPCVLASGPCWATAAHAAGRRALASPS